MVFLILMKYVRFMKICGHAKIYVNVLRIVIVRFIENLLK